MPALEQYIRKKQKIINGKKDFLNPARLRDLNREYQTIKKFFRDASYSRKRSEWEHAKVKYAKYIKYCYDSDIDAWSEFGEIHSHLEEFDKAIECFVKAIDLQNNNPFYHVRLAENYLKKGENRKALEKFKKLHLEDPSNAAYLINCAILLLRLNRKDELKDYINKLIALRSSDDSNSINRVVSNLKASVEPTPRIIKGAADNLQPQAQQKGVLLLLHVFNGATQTQIKNKWLKNITTTRSVLKIMENRKPDPLIRKERIMGQESTTTYVYFLTDAGKEAANTVIERLNVAVKEIYKGVDPESPRFEKSVGVEMTYSLADEYDEWKSNCATLDSTAHHFQD